MVVIKSPFEILGPGQWGQVNLVQPFPEPGVGEGSPHQDQAGVAGKLQIPLNHLKAHLHPLGEPLVGEDINRKIVCSLQKSHPCPVARHRSRS